MVIASQLRAGVVLKIGGEIFKVIGSTFHVGQGKMPRAAFTPACAACERIAWKSFVSGRKITWKTPMIDINPQFSRTA
jgi:translation elongation factor P/translation initiation factor 5A